MPEVQIDLHACDGCGICVAVCPTFVLELHNGKVRAVNPGACLGDKAKQLCSECTKTQKFCTGCVACVKNCPIAAIVVV